MLECHDVPVSNVIWRAGIRNVKRLHLQYLEAVSVQMQSFAFPLAWNEVAISSTEEMLQLPANTLVTLQTVSAYLHTN